MLHSVIFYTLFKRIFCLRFALNLNENIKSYINLSLTHLILFYIEYCLLSNNIYDYHIVSQGKVTVASIDDAEEMTLTDVIVFTFLTFYVFFFII